MEETKLCVACNKMQSSLNSTCVCGHVMKDAVNFGGDNTRKRRAPYRANSVSSEWIGHHTQIKLPDRKEKLPRNETDKRKDYNKFMKPKTLEKRKLKQKRLKKNPIFTEQQNTEIPIANEKKSNEIKEILSLIENSYKNIYFDRCKSYRKIKITDFDFEFDFTTFDSHAPFYPTALEDINSKINRTQNFNRIISECS